MGINEQLNVGVVGACSRGGHFKSVFDAIASARIHVVCDTNVTSLDEAAKQAGHGGGDFFEMRDFVEAALGQKSSPNDIHDAIIMTLPGLMSQQSVEEVGKWIDVPDSREW